MSIEAVNQFLQKVSQDNKLQQELIEVMEFGQNDRFAITELVVKYGFDFTPKELWQQVEKLHNNEQLEDEDLECVVGGSRNWKTIGQLVSLFHGKI